MPAAAAIAEEVAAMFHRAAVENRRTPHRKASIVDLPIGPGDLFISADLHGNRVNFDRVLELADLENHPTRHIVLQEVCHGGPSYPQDGGCMSHLLLEDVARLKVRFPERVHFILSNHELAELLDFAVVKGGRLLNVLFRGGLQSMYGHAADHVQEGANAFIRSCPLAVRTAGYAFVSHSLPARLDSIPFDETLFDRDLEPIDLDHDGAAFRLVWGRDFRRRNAELFNKMVGTQFLVHGHEPCTAGFLVPHDLQIILDGCGMQARYLILPLERAVSHAEAVSRIQRLHP